MFFRTTPSESIFAARARKTEHIYAYLAYCEADERFKRILEALTVSARTQADFWETKAGGKNPSVSLSAFTQWRYRLMRKFLGLTLTTKYILGRASEHIRDYQTYCTTCTVDADYARIEAFVSEMHAITEEIQETRAVFFSNAILGFNDALIELTGALVGFSFALRDPKFVTIAGLITGISASMSMAASAFLQARHESNRNPLLAALFTGVSYFVIALLLVTPFFFAESTSAALVVMGVLVVLMIAAVSFYSAVLLSRRYLAQFLEMCVFSLGVALVAFLIGHSLSFILGQV